MKNTLFYDKKATVFEEALPVGNGRLGAMVYGNTKKERIALNEDSLWSGYPKDLNKKDAYKYLDEGRQAIFEGDYQKAKDLFNKEMHGHWSEAYMPFGDFNITYSGVSKKNYRRSLDLEKGISTVESDGFCQTVFASAVADLIVINIKSEKGITFSATFDSLLNHKTHCENNSLIIMGRAPEVCMPPYYNKGESIIWGSKGMNFCGFAKVLGNATFSDSSINVSNQHEITIILSLATSFVDFKSMPTANSRQRALDYLDNAKTYEEMLKDHIDDFSSLFNRVDFELQGGLDHLPTDKRLMEIKKGVTDNSIIALLFQYGRYLTISGSRKGTNAMTLQGIWNIKLRAPWSSSYTTNINTEMNYWCTDAVNLSECFEPLVDFVKKLAYNGKTTAMDYYNCKGFISHHNSDIWGNTYPAGYPDGDGNATQYAVWNMSSPWLLNQLYSHYLYTRDEEFKAELTELCKGCLEFFNDYLIEKDGELVTCPSSSPENTFIDNGKRSSLTYMCSMDRGILFDFFNTCRNLGLDAPTIKQVEPASDNRVPEWIKEYEETEVHHRHASHLYCIYPSVTPANKELQEAAKKSLEVRGYGGTGWALGWKVCLWATLKEPENALKLIYNQLYPIRPKALFKTGLRGGSYPNLFDAHPPFQIDGNFGVTAGIAQMLKLQSLPENWTGYIKGLKDYDGKEISYSFKNGKII